MSRNIREGKYKGFYGGKHQRGHDKSADFYIARMELEHNGKFYELFHEGNGYWSAAKLNPPAKFGDIITTHINRGLDNIIKN